MKFEVLKKDNLKRNIIIGVFVVLIISAVILNFTRAKYRSTASVPIVDSEVNYVRPDLDVVALYINGVQANELDSSKNYTLDTTNSTCTYKDGTAIDNLTLSYDSETKAFSISPYTTRGTKCTLYFEEAKPLLADIIKSYNQSTRSDFSTVYTASTTNTVFTANDGDGTTYYFAGAPTDNYVSFAGFYWRIIRVNGDGSLRLIYSGDGSAQTTGTGTQTETSTFSINIITFNNNAYVGYMYTVGSLRGTTTDSGIKKKLDTWYQNNLSSYADKIDGNAGFCGDRTPSTSSSSTNNQGGTGITTTYYGGYIRLITNKQPTFECKDEDGGESDLYTTSGSSQGNKALQYPIGLITADEVAYAGGVYATNNTSYYLYTGQKYWTMSPSSCSLASVFNVDSSGSLFKGDVNFTYGVRPVINLKATTTISSGNGTAQNPFVID